MQQSGRPNEVPQALKRSALFTAGIIIFCLTIACWGILFLIEQKRSGDIDTLDQKIAEIDQELKQPELADTFSRYSALVTVAQQMKKIKSDQFALTPTWDRIKESASRDIQLTTVSMSDDYIFRLSGRARSVTAVARFSKVLETQTDITMVTPLAVSKQEGTNTYNFNLSFRVNGPRVTRGGQ